jgi:hypothetical protein
MKIKTTLKPHFAKKHCLYLIKLNYLNLGKDSIASPRETRELSLIITKPNR